MLKFFAILFLAVTAASPLLATEELPPAPDAEQKIAEKYAAQGVTAAERLKEQFDQMEKPAFQKAYDDYQEDLKTIAQTGRAPDNEALYDDLRQMNSDEEFVYDTLKGQIRVGFGHIMRSR